VPTEQRVARVRPRAEVPYRAVICEELVACSTNALGDSLRALVLTGSLARREETVVSRTKGTMLRSDVECLAVLHDGHPRPPAALVRQLCRSLAARLAARGVLCRVGLSVVRADYLRRLPPHIFSYELRACGEVLCGEQRILELIPPISAAQIDREDAWRTLSNRMIEQLEPLADTSGKAQEDLHYRTLKLCLDLGTSVLVFTNLYEAGYAARARRFAELAKMAVKAGLPFAAGNFARQLRECTAAKLNQRPSDARRVKTFAREIGGFAQRAWLWELREMLNVAEDDAALLVREFARQQGLWRRLRGWAYCLRRRGWVFSLPSWPRWLRLATRYSPRYAIYLAAFRLHGLWLRDGGDGASGADELRQIAALLPLQRIRSSSLSVPKLAAEISRNYHKFLAETRA